MNNIILTYRHNGNVTIHEEVYAPLIKIVEENCHIWGYNIISSEYGNLEMPLMLWILHSQKMYLESSLFIEPSIFFSPDTLIIKPFEFPNCDLGVTLNYLQPVKHMLNNGVIFINPRNKEKLIKLWDDAIKICKSYPIAMQEWGGDQLALQEALIAKDWHPTGLNVMLLNCDAYNAPISKNNPEHDKEVLRRANIIHFKGGRKKKMPIIWNELKDRMHG